MAFNYVPINSPSAFQSPPSSRLFLFFLEPVTIDAKHESSFHGQRREPNMSTKRTTTIRRWPHTESLFVYVSLCVCACVCVYRTCTVHRALLRANTATREETPIHTYKRENMKVHGNTQRQECALRLPVGLFTYISIKRRGVISCSGAAGRYKSWKWSL